VCPGAQEQLRFAAGVLTSRCPDQHSVGNPAAGERAFETAGGSLRRGCVSGWTPATQRRMPKQVDDSGLVGEKPGGHARCGGVPQEVLELLQYAPATPTVRTCAVAGDSPQINKVLLHRHRPRPRLIRARGGRGLTCSRCPGGTPAGAGRLGPDTYVTALARATDVVRQISGSDELITLGHVRGGITTATVLVLPGGARSEPDPGLLVRGDPAGLGHPGTIGAFRSRRILAMTRARASATAYWMRVRWGSVFTGCRRERTWCENYWVNNYLDGQPAPGFDILAWNEDKTNLGVAPSVTGHVRGQRAHPCPAAVEVLGHGVDLAAVKPTRT